MTFARRPLPHDDLYPWLLLSNAAGAEAGWRHYDATELGDPGMRLNAAGVHSIALYRSPGSEPTFVVAENPDSERALAMSEGRNGALDRWQAELSQHPRELVAAGRWQAEMGSLWRWMPSVESLARDSSEPQRALERLAELLGLNLLVMLTPGQDGMRATVSRRVGAAARIATTVALERTTWMDAAGGADGVLSLAVETTIDEPPPQRWKVARALIGRVIIGAPADSIAPSDACLGLAATLLGGALSDGDGASGRARAVVEERTRIASVIHEGLTQVVTNVAIQLEVLEQMLGDPERARTILHSARGAVLQALDDLRGAIFELASRGEDWTDLTTGMSRFAEDFGAQWGIEVSLDVEGVPRRIDPEVVALVFTFVQEGLTNVRKHAGVDRAGLTLIFEEGTLVVMVEDDGIGINPDAKRDDRPRGGMGLGLMEGRIRLMHGTLDVTSGPGKGARLIMRVPA